MFCKGMFLQAVIRQEFRKPFGLHLLLLAFITLVFSIAERQSFAGNYELFVLYMVTEHHLIIFCMMPLFLLSVFKLLEDAPLFVLIRSRQFSCYFFSKWAAAFLFTIVFVLLQLVTVWIVGIGLPRQNEFSWIDGSNDLFEYFQANFHSPIEAISLSVCFMIVGLTFISMTLLTLSHFFQKKVVTAFVLIAYCMMVLAIKIPSISELPFITMNRYIILHHNFSETYDIWRTAGVMLVTSIVQVILIRYAWYKKGLSFQFTLPKGLFIYYARVIWSKKTVISIMTILAVLCVWRGLASEQESIQDYFIRFFYGQKIGEFYPIAFLEQLIYMGTPLYIIGMFFHFWSNSNQLPLFIRIKSRKSWGSAVLKNGVFLQVMYVLITGLFLKIGSIVFNKSISDSSFISMYPQGTLGMLLIIKAMELISFFFIFFILFVCTKNVTIPFFAILSLFAFNIFDHSLMQYNIAGLSSVARLNLLHDEEGFSIMKASIVALLYVSSLYVVARIFTKRFFKGGL